MKMPEAGCMLVAEFTVKVDVHQGSCLSPLLFIMALEALPHEFCTGCPWENLYADDLVIMTELLEELQEKTNMEDQDGRKGSLDQQGQNQDPDICIRSLTCGMCLKGVGTNSIFCGGCSSWIPKNSVVSLAL